MRNKNRVLISTGGNVGSYRMVQTPNGNIITEKLSKRDSLGNAVWVRANFAGRQSCFNNFVNNIGNRLATRIDTKARARRNRYDENN